MHLTARPQASGIIAVLIGIAVDPSDPSGNTYRLRLSRRSCSELSPTPRHLATYLHDYNHKREHHGRITQGRRPADLVYGARKLEPK